MVYLPVYMDLGFDILEINGILRHVRRQLVAIHIHKRTYLKIWLHVSGIRWEYRGRYTEASQWWFMIPDANNCFFKIKGWLQTVVWGSGAQNVRKETYILFFFINSQWFKTGTSCTYRHVTKLLILSGILKFFEKFVEMTALQGEGSKWTIGFKREGIRGGRYQIKANQPLNQFKKWFPPSSIKVRPNLFYFIN